MSEKDFEQKRQSLQMEPEVERFIFNLVSRLSARAAHAKTFIQSNTLEK
jgi:hypothetical protein